MVEYDEARLIARDYLQTFGMKFFDTHAPEARITFFRFIFALCVLLWLLTWRSSVLQLIFIKALPLYHVLPADMALKL